MNQLALHELHQHLGAHFTEVNGAEVVAHYGDAAAERDALRGTVGVLDLSCRSRLCVTGADRVKFLHGQVTNDVQRLPTGEGCYAALVNAKGRMHSDLNVYRLDDELLLDFEPGYSAAVAQRLEKYVITEDVQLLDAAPHYGLFGVQGPRAAEAVAQLGLPWELPVKPLSFSARQDPTLGQLYLMRRASSGFDLFIPTAALGAVFDKLVAAAKSLGGRVCGWDALETARIEAGIPRFGQDMDETNLPPEAGIESRAISYSKGCYIGQEVIARIRTYGQVAKTLRGLRLPADLASLPVRGDKLLADGKEVGHLTSVVPGFALGYVRKECNAPGTVLTLRTTAGDCTVTVVAIPA
ncbi:MAG: aminomethyl transferase family protein [Limisphaerales bacterium]